MKENRSAVAATWQVVAVATKSRTHIKDITREVAGAVRQSGVENGLCYLYVPHTTAGILINESDDPDVARDIGETLDRLVPRDAKYRHYEGNADSHVKASLVGSSEIVPIEGGKLGLGRWQGIFFCEFDGPRQRQVKVRIVGD
ncbi:secondary thiamine-phosphate synthase enzyme YjbQ [Acidobacteriia bacterium AH_259_A11_L15]|nr:secondary thiamine-phosphate synthase enzyme YjbQ [Acidobacteriia bacterium AH_259_A11_L15]